MSWFSKATGIHWGNIGPAAGAIIGSIIPGVGTALGSALGAGIGGLAHHKNNGIGNIVNMAAGLGGGVGGLLSGGLSKIGSLASYIPGISQIGSALGSAAGTVGSALGSGLSAVGNVFSQIPGISGIGSAIGQGVSGLGGALGGIGKDVLGGLSKVGNIFSATGQGGQGGTDWGQLANLGLGAMDAYNAAQSGQKANSLLNKGIGQYNDNWNQGKATIMNPAPLPIAPGSQASNPFARGALDPQVQALQAYLSQQQQTPKP